jgi:hypothetical protein
MSLVALQRLCALKEHGANGKLKVQAEGTWNVPVTLFIDRKSF